jgi:hypothetical protein
VCKFVPPSKRNPVQVVRSLVFGGRRFCLRKRAKAGFST